MKTLIAISAVLNVALLVSNFHWIGNAFAAQDQVDRAILTATEAQSITQQCFDAQGNA